MVSVDVKHHVYLLSHGDHEAFTCVARFAQVRCRWISCYVIDRFATYELTQLNGAVVKIHVVKKYPVHLFVLIYIALR